MSLVQRQSGGNFESGKVNPELDKTEASIRQTLKEFKENRNTSNLMAAFRERAVDKLRVDLRELRIGQSDWGKYETDFDTMLRKKTANLENQAIFESFEGGKLHDFIEEYAKYAELEAIIDRCRQEESSEAMTKFLANLKKESPYLAGIVLTIATWLRSKEDGEKSSFDRKLDMVIVLLSGEEIEGEEGNEEGEITVATTDKETDEAQAVPASYVTSGSEPATRKATIRHSRPGSSSETAPEGGDKYETVPEFSERPLSGKEFMAKYKTLNRAKRCMLVLQQLALGNVPDHFKTFETVRVTGKYGTVVEFQVAKHGLRIGSDSDYVEVPLDGPAAQAAAEIYGCTLTTPWISEQIHKQAQETNGVVRFIAAPEIAKSLGIEWNPDKPDGNKMMSAEFVEKRNELLKAWREQHGISDSQLTSGYFKDIVHTSKQGRLEIYGGYYANGKRVQGRSGGFHGAGYYDYSHLGRFVRTNPKVNGTPMNISDFTNNSRYAMEFGFEKMQIGNTYDYTPALSRFVQQNKRERSASAFNLNA